MTLPAVRHDLTSLPARDRGQQDDSHNDWTYETGSAHSAARYAERHLRPVVEADLLSIEQSGHLPAMACPFPQTGQHRDRTVMSMWLRGALKGAVIGVIVVCGLMAAGGFIMGQEGIPRLGVAFLSAFWGFLPGLFLGAGAGWLFAALISVPRMQQERLREDHRETMLRYWRERERLRAGLDSGEIDPPYAYGLTPSFGPDAL